MHYKLIYTIAILFLMACNNKNIEPKETSVSNENRVVLTNAQLKNTKIETSNLLQKNIANVLKLNGEIDVPPQNLVSVSVPLGGYLRSTKLLPGMHINKGEIIAVLEDQQFIQLQQDYLMAKSKLHFATLEYNRQKELNTNQAISDKILQQAQAEMQQQKIVLSSLSEKLKLIHINPNSISDNNVSKSVNVYATISGFVTKVNVNIGKYITPSDVLFEIVNPSDIHLKINVFENDISKLSIGQNVIAYTNSNPEVKHHCKIILISKNVNQEGSSEVHCHFDNYDKNLLPGMYLNAEIEIQNSLSNALPEDAILLFEGKKYIFVETQKQAYEMEEVNVGKIENGFVEILNFESFNHKKIVTTGAYTLLMALKNKEE